MFHLLVAAAISSGHLPACALYDYRSTLTSKQADATRIEAAVHHHTSADKIGVVQEGAGWRLVWAVPDDSEPGVFVFRKAGRQFRLVDVWGGVALESERNDVLQWALDRKMPNALAQCFASKIVKDGP